MCSTQSATAPGTCYDPLGRLAYSLDPAERLTQYHRDPAGNLTRLIDANRNATRWEYDAANRVAKKIYADESSYSYLYDGVGNLKFRTDAKQVQTTYDYDPANNLTGISAPGLAPIGFSYDALNRRTEMRDETGTTAFGYNLASELTTIDGPWENDTIALSYDELGRPSGRSINNEGANTLVYDDYGRPQTITNPLGRLRTIIRVPFQRCSSRSRRLTVRRRLSRTTTCFAITA